MSKKIVKCIMVTFMLIGIWFAITSFISQKALAIQGTYSWDAEMNACVGDDGAC